MKIKNCIYVFILFAFMCLLVGCDLINTNGIDLSKPTITIEPISVTKEYDGTPLELSEYKVISGEMWIEKDNIHFEVTSTATLVDAGTIPATLTVRVLDENNNDVTKNYNIVTTNANIKITPIYITFRTFGKSKKYDGTPLKAEMDSFEYVSGKALNGHTLTYNVSGSITKVGEADISVYIDAMDDKGHFVNPNNYQAKYTNDSGKLVVLARALKILTDTFKFDYDGLPKTNINVVMGENELFETHNLVYLQLINDYVLPGNYESSTYNFKVTDENGNDITEYYYIDGTFINKIIINKRPITISTKDISKIYDGKPIDLTNAYEVSAGSVLRNNELIVEFDNTKFTEVGKISNTAHVSIKNGKNNVNDYYEITYAFGNLEITKLEITIHTNSNAFDYDGLEHQESNYDVVGLHNNWKIEFSNWPKVINEKETKSNIPDYKIYNNSGELVYTKGDVNKNISVTLIPGTITINEVPVEE